jgi:hypothetical protein
MSSGLLLSIIECSLLHNQKFNELNNNSNKNVNSDQEEFKARFKTATDNEYSGEQFELSEQNLESSNEYEEKNIGK